jgi:4-aminobutyrate aminotransferase-like enzyme
MIILSCGTRSLRFRPPLDVTTAEVDEALEVLARAGNLAASKSA